MYQLSSGISNVPHYVTVVILTLVEFSKYFSILHQFLFSVILFLLGITAAPVHVVCARFGFVPRFRITARYGQLFRSSFGCFILGRRNGGLFFKKLSEPSYFVKTYLDVNDF